MGLIKQRIHCTRVYVLFALGPDFQSLRFTGSYVSFKLRIFMIAACIYHLALHVFFRLLYVHAFYIQTAFDVALISVIIN